MIMLSMVLQSSFAYIADKLQREEGQDFAEYAIILALVVLAAAGAFTTLGTNVSDAVTAVGTAVASAIP